MEENKNEELTNLETEGKKKNKIVPIVSGIIAGVIALIISGILVYMIVVDLLSPKSTYIRLVNNTLSDVTNSISNFNKGPFGKLLSIDTDSKLKADINVKGNLKTDNPDIKDWYFNLENYEFNYKENIDVKNEYTDATAEFILDNEKYLEAILVQNKNIISTKVDEITDGYIVLDNNKLPELWEKIGYDGPESLTSHADMLKNFKPVTKDIKEIKNVAKDFFLGFLSAFDDGDFSYGEGSVDYDEGSIECKTMDFIINAKDYNNGIISGAEKIRNKTKNIDSLYNFISTLSKVYDVEPYSKEEFIKQYDLMLNEMRSLEVPEDAMGYILRIYYNGRKIIKVELRLDDYNTKLIEFTFVNGKDSGYYKYSDQGIVYEDNMTVIDDVTTHNVTVNYIDGETGELLKEYESEMIITIDNSVKKQQSINYKDKVRLVDYTKELSKEELMTIEPTVVSDITLKCSVDGDINNLEFISIEGDNEYTNTLAAKVTITENAKFEYANIPENEKFDASTASNDEINAKLDKIVQNWNSSKGVDQSKVEKFSAAVNGYLSLFLPTLNFAADDDYYGDIDWDSIDLEGLENIEEIE